MIDNRLALFLDNVNCQSLIEVCHEKKDLKVFVIVMQKEGCAHVAMWTPTFREYTLPQKKRRLNPAILPVDPGSLTLTQCHVNFVKWS